MAEKLASDRLADKGAPAELIAFLRCQRESVDLDPAQLGWLAGDLPITPDSITVEPVPPGSTGSVRATITALGGFTTITMTLTVDAQGNASVTDVNAPAGQGKLTKAVNTWVGRINEELAGNRRRLQPLSVVDGKLRLAKVALTAAPRQAGAVPGAGPSRPTTPPPSPPPPSAPEAAPAPPPAPEAGDKSGCAIPFFGLLVLLAVAVIGAGTGLWLVLRDGATDDRPVAVAPAGDDRAGDLRSSTRSEATTATTSTTTAAEQATGVTITTTTTPRPSDAELAASVTLIDAAQTRHLVTGADGTVTAVAADPALIAASGPYPAGVAIIDVAGQPAAVFIGRFPGDAPLCFTVGRNDPEGRPLTFNQAGLTGDACPSPTGAGGTRVEPLCTETRNGLTTFAVALPDVFVATPGVFAGYGTPLDDGTRLAGSVPVESDELVTIGPDDACLIWFEPSLEDLLPALVGAAPVPSPTPTPPSSEPLTCFVVLVDHTGRISGFPSSVIVFAAGPGLPGAPAVVEITIPGVNRGQRIVGVTDRGGYTFEGGISELGDYERPRFTIDGRPALDGELAHVFDTFAVDASPGAVVGDPACIPE